MVLEGHPLTGSFPELRGLAESLGSTRVLLDGELMVLDPDDTPSFSRIQHRLQAAPGRAVDRVASSDPAHYVIFDILHLDGHPLLEACYDERRSILEDQGLRGPNWGVTPSFVGTRGAGVRRAALRMGREGVVATCRLSHYRPGARDGSWRKIEPERTQEVVVAGWTVGDRSRAHGFGALVLGIPDGGSLDYVGKVSTGFAPEDMAALLDRFRTLSRPTGPSAGRPSRAGHVHWVEPELVGEVRCAA